MTFVLGQHQGAGIALRPRQRGGRLLQVGGQCGCLFVGPTQQRSSLGVQGG